MAEPPVPPKPKRGGTSRSYHGTPASSQAVDRARRAAGIHPEGDEPGAGTPSAPDAAERSIEDPTSVEIDAVLDGKYRLVQRIDEGGMGSVFLAHSLALDVPVAVKIIRADVRGPEKKLLGERLLQEARATARIGHPAIVRIMDFGIAPNGDPYLVMELLEGRDLATALDVRGRVSTTSAARLLLPIAHGLAAAHEQGIVHRDLKPDNIFLAKTPGGGVQPKLIDFGIAKVPRRSKRRLTIAGRALGTPAYMSPEQARGEDVDPRADVWALSVLLYEMVTGQRPFPGDKDLMVLRAILTYEPTPITDLGVADERLSAIIEKGLAKRKQDRWATMHELGAALASWLESKGFSDDVCGNSLRSTWLEVQPQRPVGEALAEGGSPRRPTKPNVAREREPDSASEAALAETEPNDAAAAKVEGIEAAAAAQERRLARKSAAKRRSRWPLGLLWIAALTGIAAAVTGWLGIPLSDLWARVRPLWEAVRALWETVRTLWH